MFNAAVNVSLHVWLLFQKIGIGRAVGMYVVQVNLMYTFDNYIINSIGTTGYIFVKCVQHYFLKITLAFFPNRI